MGLIIFALILLVVLTIGMGIVGSFGDEWYNILSIIISVFAGFIALIGLVFLLFTALEWKGSEYKADILNREYNTNYTKEEIFYGESVIETIQELNRERIEINGDLINGEK